MEELLTEFLRQSPSLAGVLVVVLLFLRHIAKSNQEQAKVLRGISDRHTKAMDECGKTHVRALEQNTKALAQVQVHLLRLNSVGP